MSFLYSNHHNTTYHIIYSEVFHSQRIKYDSTHVQRHHHHKEHSEVKKRRILRYSFVDIRTRRHNEFFGSIKGIHSNNSLSAIGSYLYKSTLISNGESKSFSIACFVSFSERLACSVGIFQSIPRVSSRILMPPSASG